MLVEAPCSCDDHAVDTRRMLPGGHSSGAIRLDTIVSRVVSEKGNTLAWCSISGLFRPCVHYLVMCTLRFTR